MLLLGPSDDADDESPAPDSAKTPPRRCAAGRHRRGSDADARRRPRDEAGRGVVGSWGWDGPDDEDLAGVLGDAVDAEESSPRTDGADGSVHSRDLEGSRWWRRHTRI